MDSPENLTPIDNTEPTQSLTTAAPCDSSTSASTSAPTQEQQPRKDITLPSAIADNLRARLFRAIHNQSARATEIRALVETLLKVLAAPDESEIRKLKLQKQQLAVEIQKLELNEFIRQTTPAPPKRGLTQELIDEIERAMGWV